MKVGAEVGGTSSDLIVAADDGAILATAKVLSTPGDPADGVLTGLDTFDGLTLSDAELLHGSTVATNAVLERSGAKVGFLVTAGFTDLLELQRQDRESIYELHYRKPAPLVSADLVREVPERIDASGKIVRAVDVDDVAAGLAELVAEGITAIAICLLHSYKNPVHERRLKEMASTLHPGLHVSISSEVVAEFREYERASTTTIDAFVKPVIDRYLGRLEREIVARGLSSIWMMQSNGGLLPAHYVRQHPARTLFSGPAAGVAGALSIARDAGIQDIVTMDMGGTSTDVCLVAAGEPEVTTEATIARLPIKVPMLDIVSIGAGGGSIVWLDSGRMLQIGPQSAGADPGPASYGRGGSLPTTTDANVLRGLIRPGHFLGGEISLDRQAAEMAFSGLARQTGSPPEALAEDVYRVASSTMANAIRLVSTERGHDPRDYTLVAYGGAGPLHAASVAEELGIGRIVIPPYPGLISAYGLLVGNFQRDFARTDARPLGDSTVDQVRAGFAELTDAALEEVAEQGIETESCHVRLGLDLRYRGQGLRADRADLAGGADPGPSGGRFPRSSPRALWARHARGAAGDRHLPSLGGRRPPKVRGPARAAGGPRATGAIARPHRWHPDTVHLLLAGELRPWLRDGGTGGRRGSYRDDLRPPRMVLCGRRRDEPRDEEAVSGCPSTRPPSTSLARGFSPSRARWPSTCGARPIPRSYARRVTSRLESWTSRATSLLKPR